jgi:hypothetical protein
MRRAPRAVLVLALAAGFLPSLPAAATSPHDLLTEKDLPKRYVRADQDPYADVLAALSGPQPCRLVLPQPSARAVFVTDDVIALDVESLTETVAQPAAARNIVVAAAKLPARCATFETPRYTVHLTKATMPRIGDASVALRASLWVKAASSPTSYVDVMEAEIAVVARRDVSVAVVLVGYYQKHAAGLEAVTRTAVRKLAVSRRAP